MFSMTQPGAPLRQIYQQQRGQGVRACVCVSRRSGALFEEIARGRRAQNNSTRVSFGTARAGAAGASHKEFYVTCRRGSSPAGE